MKKLKIFSVIVVCIAMISMMFTNALAMSFDDLNAFLQMGTGTTPTGPSADNETAPAGEQDTRPGSAIFDVIKSIVGGSASSEQIRQIISKLSSSDIFKLLMGDTKNIMDEVLKYFNAMQIPTEPTTEEPTTEEPTTEEPTTVPVTEKPTASSYTPSYSYTAPTVPVYQNTTVPETTTFEYIPPEQYYTEPLTQPVYNPTTYEEDVKEEGGTAKAVIGIVLLVGIAAGVVVFAIKLKKSNEDLL